MRQCSEKAYAACDKRCKNRDEAFFLPGSPCDRFNQQVNKPMTNADRIRSMSDQELEEFINHFNICDLRTNDECEMSYCGCCGVCVMDWLQQPAEKPKEELEENV